jgi:hypothetical protein
MRFVPATVAVLALAGVLAGCGSYTKQDFIDRADAICASTTRQTRLIAPPAFTHAKAEQLHALAGYTAHVLPLVQSEATQLRALPLPKEDARDRAAIAGYLAGLGKVVADYRKLETAAAKTDAPGVTSAEAALSASPIATLAARYGLRSCGTAGATSAS